MVCAPLEFLSAKRPSRGKLHSETQLLPLLKACHVQALSTNLTNTFSLPKLLGDIGYFLNASGCCNAKLACAACLRCFARTLGPPRSLTDIASGKKNPPKSRPRDFTSKKITLQFQVERNSPSEKEQANKKEHTHTNCHAPSDLEFSL